ncbi:hypothetical protein LIER_34457 [Lithospermum erythrorhizon]|uniref:Uncharacterized protein n=1 Tax=Lithospermum erythrorhizon TaxID=34254 RepID=A0AAV3S1Q6_LITER
MECILLSFSKREAVMMAFPKDAKLMFFEEDTVVENKIIYGSPNCPKGNDSLNLNNPAVGRNGNAPPNPQEPIHIGSG